MIRCIESAKSEVLLQANDPLSLRIATDGYGFAVRQVDENRFDLTGMHEGAEILGRQLRVESAIGQGRGWNSV